MTCDRGYSLTSAWKMLCGYHAVLQRGGDTPSASDLARRLGFAASTGGALRHGCIEQGWLEVVERPYGGSPGVVRLTPRGLAEIDRGTPPPPPPRKAPIPAVTKSTEGKRRCLCCNTLFVSAGPHNRICSSCRGTEAYRSTVDSFAVRL